MSAGVRAVVELDIDHRSAFEADSDLHDAVLGRDLEAMDRRVWRDGGFAVGSRDVLIAGLGALEGAVFHSESWDDLVPDLCRLCALEVIGEEELLFLCDGLRRNAG